MFLVVIGAIGKGSWPCRLMWTGVDFSVCVVAPPGERSVGASRGEAARRGVEVSVEGLGRLFVREHRIPALLWPTSLPYGSVAKGCTDALCRLHAARGWGEWERNPPLPD